VCTRSSINGGSYDALADVNGSFFGLDDTGGRNSARNSFTEAQRVVGGRRYHSFGDSDETHHIQVCVLTYTTMCTATSTHCTVWR
jgi:hypothetical protein